MPTLTLTEQLQVYTLLGGFLTWLSVAGLKKLPKLNTTPVIYSLAFLGGVVTQAVSILQTSGQVDFISLVLSAAMSYGTGLMATGFNEHKKALTGTGDGNTAVTVGTGTETTNPELPHIRSGG